jgi:glycerol-3-phosphate dehydrogenase (NAD(P)+)
MGIGLGAGDNTRSALITRGLAEITRLGVALGGRAETFAGLTGMGDMLATCISPQSRNHHVGVELGKGRHIDEIIEQMVMVAEGVKSAPTVIALAEKYKVDMPVARDVYNVTSGKVSAAQTFRGLLRQTAGAESEPGCKKTFLIKVDIRQPLLLGKVDEDLSKFIDIPWPVARRQ